MFNLSDTQKRAIQRLIAPGAYYELTPEEKEDICTGCGTRFFNVPDNILGLNIVEACNIHDYMYNIGQSLSDKNEADDVFLYNILFLIELGSHNRFIRWMRQRLAGIYYSAVCALGIFSFIEGKSDVFSEYLAAHTNEHAITYNRTLKT